MKKLLVATALLSTLGMSSVALANTGPSHDYISIGYTEFNSENESADGLSLGFQSRVNDTVFFEGNVLKVDDVVDGVDQTFYSLGVGYAHAVNRNVDLVGSAGTLRINVSGDADDTMNGQYVTAGVLAKLNPKVELGVNARRVFSDFNETDYHVNARYYVNTQFSIDAGYSYTDSDHDAWRFGLSYHF